MLAGALLLGTGWLAPTQAQAAPLPGTQPTSVQPLPAPVTVR